MRPIGQIVASVALLAVIGSSAFAGKMIACPQKDPLFRITIPDSWSGTWDKDGSLTCMPGNHSKYVSVVPSENVSTKQELRTQLTRTAQDAARNAQMKEVKLGAIRESVRSNGWNFMSITAQGISNGKPMVFTLAAFAPKKDNSFTIVALEPAGAHDKEISGIISSISSAR